MRFEVSAYYDIDNKPHYGLSQIGEFPKTRRAALLASISKWKAVAKIHRLNPTPLQADEIDPRPSETCALCHLYWNGNCQECPVFHAVGDTHCINSPFDLYSHRPSEYTALAEVEFLKSLLNEEGEVKV